MARKSKKTISKKKNIHRVKSKGQSVNVIVKIDQSKRTNPRASQQKATGEQQPNKPHKTPVHAGVVNVTEGLPFIQDAPAPFKPKEEPKPSTSTTINLYDPNKKAGNDLAAPPTKELLNVNQLVAGQIAPWVNLFSQQLAQSTFKSQQSKSKSKKNQKDISYAYDDEYEDIYDDDEDNESKNDVPVKELPFEDNNKPTTTNVEPSRKPTSGFIADGINMNSPTFDAAAAAASAPTVEAAASTPTPSPAKQKIFDHYTSHKEYIEKAIRDNQLKRRSNFDERYESYKQDLTLRPTDKVNKRKKDFIMFFANSLKDDAKKEFLKRWPKTMI